MTEREFEQMIANLVADGVLSEGEAETLREAWAAGKVEAADLPLAPSDAVLDLPETLMLAAVIDAILRLALVPNAEVPVLASVSRRLRFEAYGEEIVEEGIEQMMEGALERLLEPQQRLLRGREALEAAGDEARRQARGTTGRILAGLPQRRRDRLVTDLLDIYAEEANRRTRRFLFSGDYDDGLRRWQVAMREAVRDDLMAMYAMGRGEPLGPRELNALGPLWREQQARMQKFAEEIAGRRAAGRPMTEKQVAARLRMYSGYAHSAYWRGVAGGYGEGYIAWFQGYDDPSTCSRCRTAQEASPYRADDPALPLPGSNTCFGHGHCRDRLRFEYAPKRYVALSQETVAA